MKSIVTVVTAAESYDLTTSDAVRVELRKDSFTADEQILVDSLIESGSALISHYCGRVFQRETVMETFWPDPTALSQRGSAAWPKPFWGWGDNQGTHSEKLRLERYPISSITSIVVDGDPTLLTTDYRYDTNKGFVFRLDGDGYPWTWVFGKSIIVSYSGGYATIPGDLKRAATLFCVDGWSAAQKDSLIKSETVYGVASTTYFDSAAGKEVGDLSDRVVSMLELYRRYPIG